MKINPLIQQMLDKAKKNDSYWVEAAKVEFSVSLEQQKRRSGKSYKDIAELIKTSAAYISKVFRGDSNVTIETMVKLARAVDGKIEIRIVDSMAHQAKEWENIQIPASHSRSSVQCHAPRSIQSVETLVSCDLAPANTDWKFDRTAA